MKKCNFCDYCSRTDRDEQVCTKRLLYVEDLEEYPCSDFTIKFSIKEPLMVLGVCIAVLTILVLMIS